jgi:2-polyprenyl-3-methyl-5-hydroxy-6-metoxy-1,4-benzoquinol methylase
MSIKTKLAPEKMSADEIVQHYLRVHRNALRDNPRDELAAVIRPGHVPLENRFGDFAHRLGMRKAFAYLESRLGSLAGLSVLDIGCGRGRWVKEYAKRGARVTGVDLSPELIDLLAAQMPEHRFLCQDLTHLDMPRDAFEIVNSVTVLQHLTHDSQRAAVGSIASSLKEDGYLVLLENVAHFEPRHMFPHTAEEWIAIVEPAGLRCRACWGSNFEVLFHIDPAAFSGSQSQPAAQAGRAGRRTRHPAIKSAIRNVRALLSFPLELVCHWVPVARPTHSVMIFQKPGD